MFSKQDQIQGYDDELLAAIDQEERRQEEHIELIASENYCSQRVMEAQGSGLTNKYAEGYPGKRYYGGCEYVDKVGLTRFADNFPHTLSGGMKQRVAIARGMAMEPDILLMDEPFAALDALTRRTCQDELLQLWSETKFTVLFVTHSIAEAIRIGNRILLRSPHPGRVKAEVVDVDKVGSEDGSAGRLEKEIHDLLFAGEATAH